MNFKIISLLFTISSVVFCQDPGSRTMATAWPIETGKPWVYYISSTNHDSSVSDYWLYYDFNPKETMLYIWTRSYEYHTNSLYVSKDQVNRKTKQKKTKVITHYRLKTNDLITSHTYTDDESQWRDYQPDSTGYSIFRKLDELEMIYDYEQSKVNNNKK